MTMPNRLFTSRRMEQTKRFVLQSLSNPSESSEPIGSIPWIRTLIRDGLGETGVILVEHVQLWMEKYPHVFQMTQGSATNLDQSGGGSRRSLRVSTRTKTRCCSSDHDEEECDVNAKKIKTGHAEKAPSSWADSVIAAEHEQPPPPEQRRDEHKMPILIPKVDPLKEALSEIGVSGEDIEEWSYSLEIDNDRFDNSIPETSSSSSEAMAHSSTSTSPSLSYYSLPEEGEEVKVDFVAPEQRQSSDSEDHRFFETAQKAGFQVSVDEDWLTTFSYKVDIHPVHFLQYQKGDDDDDPNTTTTTFQPFIDACRALLTSWDSTHGRMS